MRTNQGGGIVIPSIQIITGDAVKSLAQMAESSVDCCVTSPPYWGLRNYNVDGQIGIEKTPSEYVENIRAVFREVFRILKPKGTLWLNLGDSYASKWACNRRSEMGAGSPPIEQRQDRLAGLKEKDLIGIPWRVAFALQSDGWYLRSDIVWVKPNCMPESVTDRPTRAHEYIFLFSKSKKYFYNADAIKEPCSESTEKRLAQDVENQAGSTRANGGAKTNGPMKAVASKQRGHSRRHDGFNERWDQMPKPEQCSGLRNKRDVWTVAPANYKGAHFATFPTDLIIPCVLAGCPSGGTVLDPFAGSGTSGEVAMSLGRNFVGIELNPDYVKLIHRRLLMAQPGFDFDQANLATAAAMAVEQDLFSNERAA